MIFFHVCFYGFSPGRKSLCNTAVYVIKAVTTHVKKYDIFYVIMQRKFMRICEKGCSNLSLRLGFNVKKVF